MLTQQSKDWEFRMNEQAAWSWRAVDLDTGLVLEQAQAEFTTLFTCVRDAERHGYSMQRQRDAWYCAV